MTIDPAIIYLTDVLTPTITAQHPQAQAAEIQSFAGDFAGFYITYILPNLQVDLVTGKVNFIVPS